MKKEFKWIWYALWLIIALVGGGGTLFSWMPRTAGMFYGGCAMLIVAVILGVALVLATKGKTWKKALITGAISGVVYTGVLAAIVYLCDEVIYKNSIQDYQPVHSSLYVVILNLVLMIAGVVSISKKYDAKLVWLKRVIALVLVVTAFVLSGMPQNWWWSRYNYGIEAVKRVTAPVGFSSYKEQEFGLVENADFYVAVDGSDENDGSFERPFATIEKARDVVRAMDKTGKDGITVAIKAGEYRISSLTFLAEDSGTEECPIMYCAYGDGEVIINAGVTLKPADFTEYKDNVVCVDLSKYGITSDDLGVMYAFGSYSTEQKYDGYSRGNNCELFVNDTRQTIARWPNEGWLETGEVLEHGEPWERNENPHTKVEGWTELRNPRGETYAISQEIADRIQSWDDLDSVWMYGYWSYDWTAASTPIGKFDYENLTLQNKFVAIYDSHAGMPYYFYNVLEELDTEGEWYLDYEEAKLYMYKSDDFAEAEILLSLSDEAMISLENANYISFRGFTVLGSKGDAFNIAGNGNTVEYCLVKNVAGNAIMVEGYNNLISSNEITKTGMGGIQVTGGDKETLTPSGNRVYNNHIHHWGETNGYMGIRCYGVGNLIDHNELHDYRDTAIEYRGNDHIIEYNLIYDVDLETSDGGAIYNGRSWTDYGCIVRYNCIYNMGTPGYSTPNAIYMDDDLSGQQIYGNLIVNVPDAGIYLHGGHDNEIWGNVVVNAVGSGIKLSEAIYYSNMSQNIGNTLKPDWESSPKDTEVWKNAYPEMQKYFWDESKTDDPYFIGNASHNKINGNVVVNKEAELGDVDELSGSFCNISNNALYTFDMMDEIFVAPDNGDYRLKEDSIIYEVIPDFEQLPIDKIGRE